MTKRTPREPKPPKGAFWAFSPSRGDVILRVWVAGMAVREMDALCRWWLKWREWDRRKREGD